MVSLTQHKQSTVVVCRSFTDRSLVITGVGPGAAAGGGLGGGNGKSTRSLLLLVLTGLSLTARL